MYTKEQNLKIMDALKIVDEYSLNTKEEAVSFLQVQMAYYQVQTPHDLLKTLQLAKELLMGLTKVENATAETDRTMEKVKRSMEFLK